MARKLSSSAKKHLLKTSLVWLLLRVSLLQLVDALLTLLLLHAVWVSLVFLVVKQLSLLVVTKLLSVQKFLRRVTASLSTELLVKYMQVFFLLFPQQSLANLKHSSAGLMKFVLTQYAQQLLERKLRDLEFLQTQNRTKLRAHSSLVQTVLVCAAQNTCSSTPTSFLHSAA